MEESVYEEEGLFREEAERRYRNLRLLANTRPGLQRRYSVSSFYVQAKYMQDFEEEREFPLEPESFLKHSRFAPCSYEDMGLMELHGYFHWRTRLRAGELLAAPEYFTRLYASELCNGLGLGCGDDRQTFALFLKLCQAHQAADTEVLPALRQWLLDFALCHGLPIRETLTRFCLPQPIAFCFWAEHAEELSDEVFLESLLSFRGMEKVSATLYRSCSEVLMPLLRCCIREFLATGVRAGGGGGAHWTNLVQKKTRELIQTPFQGLSVRTELPEVSRSYEICGGCHGVLEKGVWRFCCHLPKKELVSNLQDMAEELVGQAVAQGLLGTGARQDTEGQAERPRRIRRFVEETLARYREEAEAQRRRRVEIDFSRLSAIRQDAAAVERALAAPEMEDDAWPEAGGGDAVPPASPAAPSASPAAVDTFPSVSSAASPASPATVDTFPPASSAASSGRAGSAPVDAPPSSASPLLTQEREFLRILLAGGEWRVWARERGVVPSMLVDSINDKLLDEIGDTPLVCDSAEVPEVVEDYRGILEKMV